jgi:ABC-type transport system involved in cytochrome c biogenesis ATPase subunit
MRGKYYYSSVLSMILNETLKNHTKNGGIIIFASHFSPQIMDIENIQLEDYANN